PDVGRPIAVARRREHPELGETVENLLGDVVAAPELGRRDPRLVAGGGALQDPVLELHERPRPRGILVDHLLDRAERHEALLLELLDETDAVDELRRVVGHVARRPYRLRQEPLAQVMLDRARAHPARLGQLAHLEHPVLAHAVKLPRAPAAGPATAPDSLSASISSAE